MVDKTVPLCEVLCAGEGWLLRDGSVVRIRARQEFDFRIESPLYVWFEDVPIQTVGTHRCWTADGAFWAKPSRADPLDIVGRQASAQTAGGMSVVQPWLSALPLQQQSVVLLALRGVDGVDKHHGAKPLLRYLRGVVLHAAMYGEPVRNGRPGDSFMRGMSEVYKPGQTNRTLWLEATSTWFACIDSLPLHAALHFAHAAEIVGYKHPDVETRQSWSNFYTAVCEAFHMNPETEAQLDARLCDWNREQWYGRG